MDAQMMSRLQILTADEYRRLSDLLPSAIIRQYRESLKMTQNEFADFLGVGVASVKRWEGSGIQEKSHDELIRLKCDLRYARENLENLEDRLNVSCGATTRSVYQDFGGKSVLAIVDDYSPVNEIRLKA
jgi:transcriptional regulator with XRE-family HTH domain